MENIVFNPKKRPAINVTLTAGSTETSWIDLAESQQSESVKRKFAGHIVPAAIGTPSLSSVYTVTVKTDNTGASNNDQITIPAGGQYNIEAFQNGLLVATFDNLLDTETITLPSAGVYDLRIIPMGLDPFRGIRWDPEGDELKLQKVLAMGKDVVWSSLFGDYRNCNNLISFNAGITDTSQAIVMPFTFEDCISLQSLDVSSFNTSQVENMRSMFENAADGNIIGAEQFDISSLTDASGMFRFVSLSTQTYDQLLVNWEAQNVNDNVPFDGGKSQYTAGSPAEAARTALINDHGWTITDGGSV